MKTLHKKILTQIGLVLVFVVACWGWFYLVYWANLPDNPVTINRTKEQPVGDLTFLGEAQRFLNVYFSNSFADEEERIQFVRIEALRLADFPVRDDNEISLRDKLLKNLEQIIIKEREAVFDISLEETNLQILLQKIP